MKLSSYVLLVGMPICQNAGKQVQSKPQATTREPTPSSRQKASPGNQHPLQGKKPRQGTNTLSKAKTPRKAKSKHLVEFPFAGFFPSSLFSLSYASWAACALKGRPEHRVSGALTSRSLTQPPALWSPDYHIPKRRWCSAKRGS